MQINKKIYSILIVAMLALSTFALAIPAVFAINAPTLTPATGSVGTKVDVTGTGATAFGLVEVFWDSLGTKLGEGYATGAGAFTIEDVVIPEDVAGAHDVIVYDVLSSDTDSNTFTITSAATISANKALPGDSLTVAGTGFGDEVPVGIYLGALTPVVAESVTVANPILTNTPVVIGTVDLAVDISIDGDVGGNPIVTATSLDISVTDDGEGILSGSVAGVPVDDGAAASGAVDVTISGTINYATGVMTLTAVGVDDASGDAVTDIVVTIDVVDADYSYAVYDVTPAAGLTTSALGSVSTSVVVPNVPVPSYGDYLVTVIDFDGNTANPTPIASLTINYYILVNPISGPAGITVQINGRIPASTAYEIRLDSTTIATGTSGADTTFTASHELSTFLATGPHTFYVVWGVTNSRSAAFALTSPPQMALSSASGMAGSVITISSVAGFPFSAGANLTLYFNGAVINSTVMDDRFGQTNAFGPSAGLFDDLEFTVPTLAPGVYSIELEDEFGASTGNVYTFTVTATPVTSVALSGTTYYPGNTISFVISTTDALTSNIDVTIRDPSGAIWWTANDWPLTGAAVRTVLYQDQLYGTGAVKVRATLPTDAPLGSWNWTVTYTTTASPTVKATGLFSVMAAATLDTVTTDIADLVDEISDISDDVATIKTDVSNVEDIVEALDIDIPDFSALTNGVADLQVSVDDLDAVVSAVAGDVATVDTKVGTLEGTITSIEGDVATIQTDVGTLQADISDVKANVDNTPAWIAVVLALVAAVAAIFAVITIRQKIAG